MTETRVCFICHRERKLDKFEGHRCTDREACRTAAARSAPPRVSKSVLRKQFGSVIE